MKYLRSLLGVALVVLLCSTQMGGCGGGGGGGGGGDGGVPSDGDLDIRVSYNGTAGTDLDFHKVRVLLTDPVTQDGLIENNFDAGKSDLANGRSFTIPYGVEPGSYGLVVWWDFNDDGFCSALDPQYRQLSATFEIVSGQTTHIDLQLQDQTSPNDPGWIESAITYRGVSGGWHNLHVAVTDLNYNVIASSVGLHSKDNLIAGVYLSSPSAPSGYYYVYAYWDVNDNGIYDNDPRQFYAEIVYVSPGLPTSRLKIEIVDP